MYGGDLRWRAVTLVYAYGVPVLSASRLLGVSERAIRRWYRQFMVDGHVLPSGKRSRRAVYPIEVVQFVAAYVKQHPCFFVEELQAELKTQFDHLHLPVSHATILRVLHLDLKLSRKVLERRAREAAPHEVATYRAKLASFYSYPEQLLFIDETAKKGVDAMRKYAWSPRGERAVVKVPFRKGNRLSVLAACDTKGFVAWTTTDGTFSRHNFHAAFLEKIVPLLNPWPLPRSIVVLDNARIHMYKELRRA